MRILVCDDEREVAQIVAELARREGMDAEVVTSGPDALDALAHADYDLVVLDIMMSGMDGYEVCRRIRRDSDVPVLFLSAKNEEFDQVLGLELGADDYVTKPFRPRELMARVKLRARARQGGAARPECTGLLQVDGLVLDTLAHEATLNGEPVTLTPTEFELLAELMRHAGSPVGARELYEHVWGEGFNASARNSVMVYIRHLRKKLGAIDSSHSFIDTVWGVGYRMPVRGGRAVQAEATALDAAGATTGRAADDTQGGTDV